MKISTRDMFAIAGLTLLQIELAKGSSIYIGTDSNSIAFGTSNKSRDSSFICFLTSILVLYFDIFPRL